MIIYYLTNNYKLSHFQITNLFSYSFVLRTHNTFYIIQLYYSYYRVAYEQRKKKGDVKRRKSNKKSSLPYFSYTYFLYLFLVAFPFFLVFRCEEIINHVNLFFLFFVRSNRKQSIESCESKHHNNT